MVKQGLIISIDYTSAYCQVCYYSIRHNRPESVTTGTDVMRYLIPTVLTYDMENSDWLIGSAALENAQLSGSQLYTNFLENAMMDEEIVLGDKTFSSMELFAIFLGKMIEMAKKANATKTVFNVTVNLRQIDRKIKSTFAEAFELIGITPDMTKYLCCSESFAYYVLAEDVRLWQTGALLFDFSEDGFFIRLLKVKGERGREFVYVEETDCNEEFLLKDLGSEILRRKLDGKLKTIFEDIYADNKVASVYFVGSGFDELWFEDTLGLISEQLRAFKGNNIYVKGACLSGFRRMSEQPDYPIISKERSKIQIATTVRSGSESKLIALSSACSSWHDAGSKLDLIPDNASWITFEITSALTGRTETLDFDLEEFPTRPNKATRLEVSVRYPEQEVCELMVKDKGFGEFFPSSGKVLTRRIVPSEYY